MFNGKNLPKYCTNGQNLLGKEDKLAFLYPKLVGVSIYSGIPSIHDTITRVKGSFDKSVKVLEHLSSLSVPLYVKCCVMRTNFDSYNSVFDLAKKVNAIPQIEINIVDSIDGNKYVSTNLRLNSEQLESLLDDVRTLQAIDISSDDILSWKRNMNENACRAGFNTFNITPDGDLVPCCSFHLPFGNIKNQSISDIVKNSAERKRWIQTKLSDYEQCGRWDYCCVCSICPGHNYSEHNDPLKAAENCCYLAKVKYGYLIKKRRKSNIINN